MSKLHMLMFVLGLGISIYGLFEVLTGGEGPNIVLIFGGIVITAIAAGLIGKAHVKGSDDAG